MLLPVLASTLPALSVLQKVMVCVPFASIEKGALYVCAAPPLTLYSVLATPERLSLPASVTWTGWLYQSFFRVPDALAAVVGAVRSIWMPLTVLVAVLPALSAQVAVADRLAPSPVTVVAAGCAAGPDSASVQVQVTVTSPFCQPLGNVPVSTGAVLSMLTVTVLLVALLPAASVAVPLTLWLAPSLRVVGADLVATPESASLAV